MEELITIFHTHKEIIYPWIKVLYDDQTVRATEKVLVIDQDDFPIYREWIADLAIFYVADLGEAYQMILNREIPPNMTEKQLYDLAVSNLQRDIEYKYINTDFGGFMLLAGGNHEASSICLPGIWENLSEFFNDNLIVAIPAKDLVLFVPEKDTDSISNMKIFVYELFSNPGKLLTRNILKFEKDTKSWSVNDIIA